MRQAKKKNQEEKKRETSAFCREKKKLLSTFWYSEDALNSCLLRKSGNRLEQTTAFDGLLDLRFGLGDPYLESIFGSRLTQPVL